MPTKPETKPDEAPYISYSAKQAFQSGPRKDQFKAFIESDIADQALNHALLEFVNSLPNDGTVEQGWGSHNQLAGVRKFIHIFRNLHIPDKPLRSNTFPNLKAPS